MTRIPKSVFFVFVLLISLLAIPEVLAGTGAAERAGTIQHSLNMLDTTILNSAKAFEFTVWKYVNALFWTLAGISLAWTAIEMALKQAEFGEIVAELCKFIVTTGFFFYLALHGTEIATSFVDGIETVAGIGAGIPDIHEGGNGKLPALIVSQGASTVVGMFTGLPDKGLLDTSLALVVTYIFFAIAAVLVFFIFVYLAIKILMLQIILICQIYAGTFILGFGGCKWMRESSINYFKSVIATSLQFFMMLFLCSILTDMFVGTGTLQGLMAQINNVLKQDDIKIADALIPTCILTLIPICFLFIGGTLPSLLAGLVGANFANSDGNMAKMAKSTASGTVTSVATGTAVAAATTGKVAAAAGGVYQQYQELRQERNNSKNSNSSGSSSSTGSSKNSMNQSSSSGSLSSTGSSKNSMNQSSSSGSSSSKSSIGKYILGQAADISKAVGVQTWQSIKTKLSNTSVAQSWAAGREKVYERNHPEEISKTKDPQQNTIQNKDKK